MKIATVVKVYPTAVWIEDGWGGERRVMLQHEGCEPFAYATFGYDYRYTSNAGTHQAAHALAVSLGAKEPVEHRGAPSLWADMPRRRPWWKFWAKQPHAEGIDK